jgi:hypothetical protein
MVKALSLRVADAVSEDGFDLGYDRIREMVAVAKKTGLDFDTLGFPFRKSPQDEHPCAHQ